MATMIANALPGFGMATTLNIDTSVILWTESNVYQAFPHVQPMVLALVSA